VWQDQRHLAILAGAMARPGERQRLDDGVEFGPFDVPFELQASLRVVLADQRHARLEHEPGAPIRCWNREARVESDVHVRILLVPCRAQMSKRLHECAFDVVARHQPARVGLADQNRFTGHRKAAGPVHDRRAQCHARQAAHAWLERLEPRTVLIEHLETIESERRVGHHEQIARGIERARLQQFALGLPNRHQGRRPRPLAIDPMHAVRPPIERVVGAVRRLDQVGKVSELACDVGWKRPRSFEALDSALSESLKAKGTGHRAEGKGKDREKGTGKGKEGKAAGAGSQHL